jgi:hypothetical protein
MKEVQPPISAKMVLYRANLCPSALKTMYQREIPRVPFISLAMKVSPFN